MTTDDDLEAAAKAATPGPWEFHGSAIGVPGDRRPLLQLWRGESRKGMYVSSPNGPQADEYADARFIAAADPQTVLALLARVRAAEAENLARTASHAAMLASVHADRDRLAARVAELEGK